MPHKGYKASEETREKQRQAKLRNPTRHWLGKKLSEEHKNKLMAGRDEHFKKNGHPLKDADVPVERRAKIASTLKKQYKKGNIISPFKKKWESGEFGPGKKSPAYIDGRSREGQALRGTPEYAKWRGEVLKRDGYACTLCHRKGTKLEVDHYPRTFSRLFRENKLDLLWDARNGRTLCVECHRQFGERANKRDFRGAFIAALVDAARKDNRVTLAVNDVGFSKIEAFQNEFPDRFYNFGVTETSTVGLLAGMALSGLRPFHYTMLTFCLFRPFEYLRNAVCHQNAPVVLVGITGSQHYRMLGAGHNPIPDDEDVRIISHLPNLKIFLPKTAEETEKAVHDALEHNGPSYIRL